MDGGNQIAMRMGRQIAGGKAKIHGGAQENTNQKGFRIGIKDIKIQPGREIRATMVIISEIGVTWAKMKFQR